MTKIEKMTKKTAEVLASYSQMAGEQVHSYDLSRSDRYHMDKLVKLGYAAKVKPSGFSYMAYIIHPVQVVG